MKQKQNDSKIKNGDKLPHSLLTDNEWAYLTQLFKNQPKPFSKEFLANVRSIFSKYNQEKELALKHDICVLCGENKRNGRYVCKVCEKGIYHRNVLRCCGKARGYSYRNMVCECCEKGKPVANGLCRSCYSIKKYHRFKSNQEVCNYINSRFHSKCSLSKNSLNDDASAFFVKAR